MGDCELLAKLERQKILSETSPPSNQIHESFPCNPVMSSDNPNLLEQENTCGGAADELRNRLARRQQINDGKAESDPCHVKVHQTIFSEFHEFSRKQIKDLESVFRKYDVNKDGFIDFEELKHMMEGLGEPQTHLALKAMIKLVDEDNDSKINLREFLLIFRKAAAGELEEGSGLSLLADKTCVDVSLEGVHGAAQFFQAKIEKISKSNKFEDEIRVEQEEKKAEAEERRQRQLQFKAKQDVFK